MSEDEHVDPSGLRVAYLLKQYPRLSETFILSEILGLEELGAQLSIHSLRPATEGRFHAELAKVRAPVHYVAPPEKAALLDAMRALIDVRQDALAAVIEFADRLPAERRSRLVFDAVTIAGRVLTDEVDHLHAHFLTVAAQTAHAVHLLTGIPYTVTAHAKDIYRNSVDWRLAGHVAGAASAIVTVCDANRRHLEVQLAGSGARIVRVYNGLGPQAPPAPAAERTPGLILGVGRLVEKKGFDVLLDAVALLRAGNPQLTCTIVGDGDERAALEARASSLGIADAVTFTGAQPQEVVARWLRRASVLVAPCRIGADGNQDALPTVLLEALGAGLPAVSTPVAGICEIVEDGIEGVLVPSDDAPATAGAISRVLSDGGRWAAMSEAGPRKLASRFDRATTIRSLYEAMLPARVPA